MMKPKTILSNNNSALNIHNSTLPKSNRIFASCVANQVIKLKHEYGLELVLNSQLVTYDIKSILDDSDRRL